MSSKALVVGTYQHKLEELARQPDLEVVCIVPPAWRQDGRDLALERAHTDGYELIVAPIRWNGSFHLFYFPTLGRDLERLRPDVVHVDEEPYNLATLLAFRQARTTGARPLFFTWQNLRRRYPPPFCWFQRYVLRHAAHAIAGSADAARVLREKRYRGPLAVIPQFGIDPTQFSPATGPRPAGAPFTIGYLGRLVEEKGLLGLLQAVAGLRGEWRLELFGHGPLRRRLEARARELGIGDRLRIAGPVPSTSVPDRLRALDALVLPSLTRPNWKEQFGRILVEAMACGVPVVGSASGEIPNVIGEAGLIFPEGDVAGLRACLGELLESDTRRAALASRGRARVLARYTHRKIAEATAAVYREMTSAAPGPASEAPAREQRPLTRDSRL